MNLTDEQRAVRDVVREFAVEEIRPNARERDENQEFPEDVWDGLAELDMTGLTVPEEYGGYDADKLTYSVVNEEVAYGSLSVATALSVHCLATSCIAGFGGTDQQEEDSHINHSAGRTAHRQTVTVSRPRRTVAGLES
jgi:alkylation response protein AidB-like acyl-CoA dehydrogenase